MLDDGWYCAMPWVKEKRQGENIILNGHDRIRSRKGIEPESAARLLG
jgi:hypothetical protein